MVERIFWVDFSFRERGRFCRSIVLWLCIVRGFLMKCKFFKVKWCDNIERIENLKEVIFKV